MHADADLRQLRAEKMRGVLTSDGRHGRGKQMWALLFRCSDVCFTAGVADRQSAEMMTCRMSAASAQP
jgi:hypothetical protein